ncbi:hypothetical protein EEL31_09480 [Brevibacillus laterosporus]|nr:hypothetical protein [Brevibacillus laterosporus]TPG68733.1 hypothetical protein EEL31_09480 [Brevibacillus laterosporus]
MSNKGDGIDLYVCYEESLPKVQWGGEDFKPQHSLYSGCFEEVRSLYVDELLSLQEIGAKLNIDWWIVRSLLENNGIPIEGKVQRYEARRKKDFPRIYDLHYTKGMTLKQIYEQYGLSPVYTRKVLIESGFKPLKRNQYGIIKDRNEEI